MKYTQLIYLVYLCVFLFGSILGIPMIAFASEGHLDWTNFIYRVLNLFAFIGIIYFVAGKKISSFFKNRKKSIREDFTMIEQQKKDVSETLKEIKKKVELVEDERVAILSHAQKEALALKDAMLKEAELEIERIADKTHQRMMREQEKVKQQLIKEVADRIYVEVENRLQEMLTPSMQKQILHSSMQKVVTFEKEIGSKTLR